MPRRRLLLISSAPVGPRMAGPAIRYVQMARLLRATCDVTLAAPNGGGIAESDGHPVASFSQIAALARSTDVVISQGVGPYLADLADIRARRVFDLYDPVHIEAASYFAHETGGLVEPIMLLQLRAVMRWGDDFLCAGPRQRDMWLGLMSHERRVLGDWIRCDDPLARWIEAPFGIDERPPQPGPVPVLRGVLPGIDDNAFILLWNGGLWNWLDPLTPIRAVARCAARSPSLHLVFLGGAARGLALPRMRMARAARDEARRLHLLDRQVHFVPRWVDYAERGAWLLESDAVISAGPPGLEHHFAYRTRLLDAVWSGRAVIASPGEVVAERLAAAGAARLPPPGDDEALATLFEEFVQQRAKVRAMGERAATLRLEWSWPHVLKELVRLCAGEHAPPGDPARREDERRGGERRWYDREHFKLKQLDRWNRWSTRLKRFTRRG